MTNNRLSNAVNLFNKKKFDQSLKILEELHEKEKTNIDILNLISLCCVSLSKFEEARKFLLLLCDLDKANLNFLNNLAFVYQKLFLFKMAENTYREIIKKDKNNLSGYLNLGSLLKRLQKYESSIEVYQSAIQNNIKSNKLLTNLSSAYLESNQINEAITYASESINLDPNDQLAYINLSSCFIKNKKFDLAINYLNKAKKINENNPLLYLNYGVLYKNKNEPYEAKKYFNLCIKKNPNTAEAYLYKSLIELAENDFKEGWLNYEYRWYAQKKRIESSVPFWEANSNYKKILIWGEQGLGEQILFGSILNDMIDKFDKINLVIDPKLKQIFKESFKSIKVLSYEDNWKNEDFDCQLPMGSLGKFFRIDINSFNRSEPYLKIARSSEKKINQYLSCGISWKSVKSIESEEKSINLNDLTPLFELKDNLNFFNIQYSNIEKELNEFNLQNNNLIKNLEGVDLFNDLYGVASHLQNFDFIVTISNTTAHLSAALGIPTYLLLSNNIGRFWYWSNNINGNHLWYKSVKIFRQKNQGDWGIPIDSLIKYIREAHRI